MPDLSKAIENLRQQEIKIASAGGYGSEWLEEESKVTDAELDSVDKGLSIRLPLAYRTFVKSFRVEKGDADFSVCRMSDLILLTSWDEIFENMGIGAEAAIQQAIRTRQLLPIGDDYSGLYWICLDLAHSTEDGSEAPLVELNLESEPEFVLKNFEGHIEQIGPTFIDGIENLHKSMLKELEQV